MTEMEDKDFRTRPEESTRFTTVRDWCAAGFRRRRLILTSFAGLLLGTILFTAFWAARYYESTMQILVLQARTDLTVSPAPNAVVQNTNLVLGPDQINSEMALLQEPDILREVAHSCGLSKKFSFTDFLLPSDPQKREAMKTEKAARKLAKALDVEVEKQADVIDVTYGHTGDPETPACVLSTLSKLYLQRHLETHRPQGSLDVFVQATDQYHRSLETAEQHLSEFAKTSGIGAPDVELPTIAKQLADTEGLLEQSQQAVVADKNRIKDDEDHLQKMSPRMLTKENDAAAALLIQQLGAQLLLAQQKRVLLLMKYAPDYPLVTEADQEVAQAQAAMEAAQKMDLRDQTTDTDPTYELLREDLAKTRADLATQEASTTALSQAVQKFKNQTVDLNQQLIEQVDLQREVKANEDSYLLYLHKRDQELSSDAMDEKRVANVALSAAPSVPLLPAYNPLMVFVLGFLFSLVVSIGLGFVVEYLDPSFQTPADVTSVLQVPVLASFPRRAA
jgi:succinoglycan biosynthesis transport protein ExoP